MKGMCENCCAEGADTICYNYSGNKQGTKLCEDCYEARKITREEDDE